MLIFVYECLSAGGMAGAESLHREGRAMLSAVLEDLSNCRDVRTVTLLAARPESKFAAPAAHEVHPVTPEDEATAFRRQAARADGTLVIAPEFDDLLYTRCRWVEESGGRLLGPTADAVRLTGDKLSLAAHFLEQGVPTPPCSPLPFPDIVRAGAALPAYPFVIKPRHGAGSQATFLIRDTRDRERCAGQLVAEQWHGPLIAQPFREGRAASVAFLLGPGRCLALPAAAQQLSADGRFHYLGGSLPLPPDFDERARRLARRAVTTVAGLRGYVGVDLVLGAAADGRDDVVIEINPRLTTSYLGLRALARFNLAAALLAVVRGEAPPAWGWRDGLVSFRAGGQPYSEPEA